MAKRRVRALPNILTEEERLALLKSFNKRYPTSYRNYCITKLCLECMLRVSEVINLKIEHIDWNTGKLYIKNGKGKKDRILWIKPKLLEELIRLRKRFNLSNTGLLFSTLKGNHLDRHYLHRMIKRKAIKAKISKRVYCHLLRHTGATKLYKETKDLLTLQKILGHSFISSTTIYTHIDNEDVKRVMLGE